MFPAFDIEKSVSRIGAKAQPKLMTSYTTMFKSLLVSHKDITEFLGSGISLTDKMLIQYRRGTCAVSSGKQKLPVYYEYNILSIANCISSILCPKFFLLSNSLILNKIELNYFFILELILISKSSKKKNCTNLVKNLISYIGYLAV